MLMARRLVRRLLIRRNLVTFGVAVIALALIAYGVSGLLVRYRTTHTPPKTITHQVITDTTDAPSETKPTDACTNYQVGAAYPKRIDIDNISANGCIEQVGLTNTGAIATPDNIYAAAWYTETVLPGQPGLSVILGHISGRYNVDGIFQHLNKLKAGDIFTVTLGSGKVLRYQVYREQSVPLDNGVSVLLAKDLNIQSQLNLITCGGQYDKAIRSYDHRIIVSAKLVTYQDTGG